MGDGLATSRLCTASRRLYPQPTIHPCRTSLWGRLCSRAPDSWRNQHHNLAQAPLAGLSTPIHLRCAPQSSHRGLQASTTAPTHADPTFHNIRATLFGWIMLCPNLPAGHSSDFDSTHLVTVGKALYGFSTPQGIPQISIASAFACIEDCVTIVSVPRRAFLRFRSPR